MTDPDPTPDPPAPDPAPAPADPPADPVDDVFDKDRAMALIGKLRPYEKAALTEKTRADKLEAELREIQDRNKSDDEKRAERLAALESEKGTWDLERQSYALKLAVFQNASRLGIADADLALAALDRSQVEYNEHGDPANIDTVLTALLEAKPLLKGVPAVQPVVGANINAGAGVQNGKRPDLSADELETAGRMGLTADEYAAFKGKRSVGEFAEAERVTAPTAA